MQFRRLAFPLHLKLQVKYISHFYGIALGNARPVPDRCPCIFTCGDKSDTTCTFSRAAEIINAYALDNQRVNIWWAAFLRETHSLRDNKGALNSPSSPDLRRPWEGVSSPPGGGVAGAAAPYFDYSNNPLDSPVLSGAEISAEADSLLAELALFFRTRRVDVSF